MTEPFEVARVTSRAAPPSNARGGAMAAAGRGRILAALRGLAWRTSLHLYDQRDWLIVVTLYLGAAGAFLAVHDKTRFLKLDLYAPGQLLLGILAVVALRIAVGLAYRRVRFGAAPAADFAARWGRRLARSLPVLVGLPLVLSLYSSVKSVLLQVFPATWDPAFARTDRWLHGGVDPQVLLQSWIGGGWIGRGLDLLYVVWFFVVALVTCWQVFQDYSDRARFQYLMTFVLSWALLGNLLAALLMSGGPVYYGELTGDHERFRAVLEPLRGMGLVATDLQQQLWAWAETGEPGPYRGISAMPSMHVAIAVCLALAGWSRCRAAGAVLTLYAAIVLVASVYLGWHYAIDGYVSVVLVLGLWSLAGRIYDGRRTAAVRSAGSVSGGSVDAR